MVIDTKLNKNKFEEGRRYQRKVMVFRRLKFNIANNIHENQKDIAKMYEVSQSTVSKIYRAIINNPDLTEEDLKEEKRGPEISLFNKIPKYALNGLREATTNFTPQEFELRYSSWGAKAIRSFLKTIYKIDVKISYIYYFLKRNGFSSKSAKRINPKRDDAEVDKFQNETYPDECKKANESGEIILFGDECHTKQDENNFGFSPKGERSSMSHSTSVSHSPISLLIFISICGFIRIFPINYHYCAELFIEALKWLKKENPGKKFLIFLDNHSMHQSKKLKSWLNNRRYGKGFIRIAYLPKYCPDMNPVEFFNNIFKNYLRQSGITDMNTLMDITMKFCDRYNCNKEQEQEIVRSVFDAKECNYTKKIYLDILERYKEQKAS